MASTSGVVIREANGDDLNALLVLIDLVRLEQSAESCVQPLDPGDPHQWQFSDGDRAECVMVAIDLQPPQTGLDAVSELPPQPLPAIVGFARYGQYRVKRAYDRTVQSTVFVHPRARGRGVGSALYMRLIDQARLKNVRCGYLCAVFALLIFSFLKPISA
jgi:GNAT superfamily N-acetyltransferase